MSQIEERFARDIAAVTGGVVVTESDLRVAREAVIERTGGRRRRAIFRPVALAAAAAVALAAVGATAFVTLSEDGEPAQLAGPGTDRPDVDADYLTGSLPTEQLVDGVWRLDNGRALVKFDGNGGVRFDDRGRLFSSPATTGAYVIDGDRIIVTTSADDETGCIGTAITMRASFPEPGAMRFVVSDTAGACSPLPSGRQVLEQVLPTSRAMTGYAFSEESGWRPLSDKAVLHGIWMAEGGGHVVEMDPDGSYFVADDSGEPIDSGQWSLRGPDLTLTSSGRSTTCSNGEQFVLGAVEWLDSGTSALRGTVKENACGGAWTPVAWFLIPDASS